ncbi:GNAT family N-acetyltransferase [Dyadobacter sp. NIV53]|uniref:GNAT family N-acetyltransferase n=1 Tax=Dyadobacter sp. NIV53 TaxID=2861765 RepID=UPI001C8822B3|nr:GNAT family N-acetyltransferase [Dyadobacter sp. NIV53]
MNIRKYQDADREKIIALLRLNTPEYFSPDEEKDLIYYFDNHIEYYFVAETDGVIVGCGGFNMSNDPKKIGLSWDIVHPEYQGKGVGSALIKYRIDRIKELGKMQVITVRTSQLAYKFYEKFGFEIKEIVKDYWAAGFDLYRMECSINLISD